MPTFTDLKEGDDVIYDCGNNYGFKYSLHKVERITPTQIKLVDIDAKFRHNDGYQIARSSQSWTFPKLKMPTPELLEAIERNSLCAKISKANFESLPIETLRAIKNLLPNQPPPPRGRAKFKAA